MLSRIFSKSLRLKSLKRFPKYMYSNENLENLKTEKEINKTNICTESLRKQKIRQLEIDITDKLLEFESKKL